MTSEQSKSANCAVPKDMDDWRGLRGAKDQDFQQAEFLRKRLSHRQMKRRMLLRQPQTPGGKGRH